MYSNSFNNKNIYSIILSHTHTHTHTQTLTHTQVHKQTQGRINDTFTLELKTDMHEILKYFLQNVQLVCNLYQQTKTYVSHKTGHIIIT